MAGIGEGTADSLRSSRHFPKPALCFFLVYAAMLAARASRKVSRQEWRDSRPTRSTRMTVAQRNAKRDYMRGLYRSKLEHFRAHAREKRAKMRKDPAKRVEFNLRNRITKEVTAIRRAKKSAAGRDLIGCTTAELRAHIERQWKRGMTWENYGTRWHIDHIIPCASFDLRDPNQQRVCFNFMNLQPLWATQNLMKGDKIITAQMPLGLTA